MSNWLKPLLLATVLLAFSAQAQQPIVIKFPHVVSEKSPKGQAALVFKKRAE